MALLAYIIYYDNDFLFERKRFRKPEGESIEKLESRIHYMKLDISNLNVELANCREELCNVKNHVNILGQINSDLEYLDKLDFYLKNINEFSMGQIEKKYMLFIDEDNEHAQLCMNKIMQIENLPEVKNAMILALKTKRVKNKGIGNELRYVIKKKYLINLTQFSSAISLFVIMISVIINHYIKKIE